MMGARISSCTTPAYPARASRPSTRVPRSPTRRPRDARGCRRRTSLPPNIRKPSERARAGALAPAFVLSEENNETVPDGTSVLVWRGDLVQYVVAVLVGLALSQLATLITTVYLHRVLSHRSIRLHPALTMMMRFGTRMLTRSPPAPPRAPRHGPLRPLDANGHPAQGVGGRPPQAPQLQRRRGRPPQPPHRGVLADHDRQRLLLQARGKKRQHPGEVCRRPPLRPARQVPFQVSGAGLRLHRSAAGALDGPRSGPRGAHRAHGRVHSP